MIGSMKCSGISIMFLETKYCVVLYIRFYSYFKKTKRYCGNVKATGGIDIATDANETQKKNPLIESQDW